MTKCDFQKSHLVINVINPAFKWSQKRRRTPYFFELYFVSQMLISNKESCEKTVRGNSVQKVTWNYFLLTNQNRH